MRLDLRQTPDGVVVPIHVVPRASRTEIDGAVEGTLRVRLAAPPVDGAANKALIEFMARVFDVRRRDVELVAGERSKRKSVLIQGVSLEAVMQLLGEND